MIVNSILEVRDKKIKETLNWSKWYAWNYLVDCDMKEIPTSSGVYEVRSSDCAECLDIGKAANLRNRMLRRLIRGIEVASWKLEGKVLKLFKKPKYDLLEIGLQASQNNLSKKIKKRVNKRINDGVEAEIKKLISSGISWDSQSMTSLGYRQWRDYFEGLPAGRQGKIVKDGVIDSWKKEELRYAKRQLTWFKKDLRINWFDSSKKNFIENVEELVKKWYP